MLSRSRPGAVASFPVPRLWGSTRLAAVVPSVAAARAAASALNGSSRSVRVGAFGRLFGVLLFSVPECGPATVGTKSCPAGISHCYDFPVALGVRLSAFGAVHAQPRLSSHSVRQTVCFDLEPNPSCGRFRRREAGIGGVRPRIRDCPPLTFSPEPSRSRGFRMKRAGSPENDTGAGLNAARRMACPLVKRSRQSLVIWS